jgi:hypothetical protein
VNPLIFRASRYVLWGEIKNLAFEDKKEFFSRNDFGTAKSCKFLLFSRIILPIWMQVCKWLKVSTNILMDTI